jgi:hypothetical protein
MAFRGAFATTARHGLVAENPADVATIDASSVWINFMNEESRTDLN